MSIYIAENLKKLRRAKEITQEKLAEVLGLTSQSVSKWECGENFPDITLLPGIANFFGVTVDELLGMNEISNAKRVEDAHALTNEMRQNKPGKPNRALEIVKLWEDMARDMPHNWEAQLYYASYLSEYGSGGADKGTRELNVAHKTKVIPVLERIIANCADDEIRYESIGLLACVYSDLHEFDKAREVIKKLPAVKLCREYPNEIVAIEETHKFMTEGGFADREDLKNADPETVKKLLEPFETALQAFLLRANNSLINLHNFKKQFGQLSAEENIRYINYRKSLGDIVRKDNSESYDPRAYYQLLIGAYCELGDVDTALDFLGKFIDEVITRVPASQLANHITWETNEFGNSVPKQTLEPERKLTANMFAINPEYAPILNHPRFQAETARLLDGGDEAADA
ncbi:MAG: helix-turn-helix domain-containing protein [Oscillospiraceae bacterium]|jgi:transcriptional regulator with XRE-family HTH domain|nr:helix-turn-helix domain-containing protein [Oscillospiraceae bacterium]